eukprot:172482_1
MGSVIACNADCIPVCLEDREDVKKEDIDNQSSESTPSNTKTNANLLQLPISNENKDEMDKNKTTETPSNMTEKQHVINTDIFDTNDNKCNGYNECSCIKRIMTALGYYQQISSTQAQKFIDFCDTHYSKQYLQDY